MNKIGLLTFLISAVAFGVCTTDKPIVRLDSTGGSLEKFKTIDQDGMGICYSSVATVLLKSAYPDKATPSQIDLAMKYAKKNNDKEDSLKEQINGGFTHKAFNFAMKEKICRGVDVNLEVASNDFSSRSMETYFDTLDAFKKNFDNTKTDESIYFKKLSSISSAIEKECEKPHDKRIRQSIRNAFYSLKSIYDYTIFEAESLKKTNVNLVRSLPLISQIEDDSKKLRLKKENLIREVKDATKKENKKLEKRKQKQLSKILDKLTPFENQLKKIKNDLGDDLFSPSDKLLSIHTKSIIADYRELIVDLRKEAAIMKKSLDGIGTFSNLSIELSPEIENYLKGKFKDKLREFTSDYKMIETITDEQADIFFDETIRKKFPALDAFYLSPSGTLADFKMNNSFICAQYYFQSSLINEEPQKYYNMCNQYAKEEADNDSFNALASILESGSNMNKLFSNIQQMVEHLEGVAANSDTYDQAYKFLSRQCIDKINYKSATQKSVKPVYFGLNNTYDHFKANLPRKKKILEKQLWRSLDKGHAIGISIAGKMLKGNYNAYAEETNNTLETSDFEHGLHAVALIGVDCSAGKRKYLIQNSWGTSCLGVKDISSIQCEKGTGRLWIDEDYLLNNTRYLSVVK
jgi:hypothetical protein